MIHKIHAAYFSLQSGQFSEDMIPTVGFNMRKVTKGNVTIKVGQQDKKIQVVASSIPVKSVWYRTSACLEPSYIVFSHLRYGT